jgi:hypothetical protein
MNGLIRAASTVLLIAASGALTPGCASDPLLRPPCAGPWVLIHPPAEAASPASEERRDERGPNR